MPDLSEAMRRFLGSVREDEIENLRMLATLRKDEREALTFVLTNFTMEDLEVISGSLENLRALKRFGRFGLWLAGFIIAGASAAAIIKVFFVPGVPK